MKSITFLIMLLLLILLKSNSFVHSRYKYNRIRLSNADSDRNFEIGLNEQEFMTTKQDISLYGLLGLIQILPPLALIELPEPYESIRKPISYTFFILTSSIAVYLGSKRQDLKQLPSMISKKSIAIAPLFSSFVLFGLYLLLKYSSGYDIFFYKMYQILGTFLGLNCIDTVVTALLNSNTNEITDKSLSSNNNNDYIDDKNSMLPMSSPIGLTIGSVVALSYLTIATVGGSSPEALCALSLFNNLIAVNIALQAIGSIRVESFAIACGFLGALFFYDIFWVFGTDVMMTVATKVEAPVKFLFPASPELMASRPYPFSVLGLGDLVVPGIMCALGRKIDVEGLVPPVPPMPQQLTSEVRTLSSRIAAIQSSIFKLPTASMRNIELPINEVETKKDKSSYLNAAMLGYIVGIAMAFTANEITKAGQPALLYLVPCVISSMLYTAYKNKEVTELWGKGLEIGSLTKQVNQ